MNSFKKLYLKPLSFILIFSILYQVLFPSVAFALTGGPSQPEIETFSPISSNDMVDLFSGDFKYNIPLLEVGDYPLNLIYNSNPTMDQEASWVGLGWNINSGSVNRSLRGLADDYKSDTIIKEFNMTDNKTWGVDVGAKFKLLGINFPSENTSGDSLSLSLGVNLGVSANNYKGYGVSLGVSPALSAAKGAGGSKTAALGLHVSSQDGVSISADAGIASKEKDFNTFENNIGLSYNTRAGLKDLSFSSSFKNLNRSVSELKTSLISGYPTFTPTISMPLKNHSFTISGSVGGAFFFTHGNVTISGFWSTQTLESRIKKISSYGYLNSSEGSKRSSSLLDYNREKDIPYNKSVPNLPIPNFTYDVFNVTGEGVSGQFRPYRGDIGILYDAYTISPSNSTDAGIQLGFGNLFHGGGQINNVNVNTTSTKWLNGNALGHSLEFVNSDPYPDFEDSYFKSPGEFTLADTALFHKVGDEEVVRNMLQPRPFVGNLPVMEKFSTAAGSLQNPITASQQVFRSSRDRRSQFFSYLTANEASNVGLDKDLLLFKPDSLPYKPGCIISYRHRIPYEHVGFSVLPREIHPPHHISEITITKPDGNRYIYGIPAYNNFQKDVTFACRDLGLDPGNGLVDYTSGVDNNKDRNTHGLDHYYSSERTPSYAYSYLLSGILSPDYIDRTGNGISSDDNGEAIRFNYSRTDSNYLWRIPFEQNKANYNGGLHSGNGSSFGLGDAKGSYSYGSKELWYTHSIESKNMLAQFYLENREDGIGVKNEDGGKYTYALYNHHQKLLKEIRLYNKSDILKYGTDAIPVKIVHFVYDYSLCPGVPNNSMYNVDNSDNHLPYYVDSSTFNQGGKLTLRKVYFTYGNNTKGQLNSYRFNYSDFNPSYEIKKYDRWGNYKDNSELIPDVTNAEFPYTLQDSSLTNKFARAWNINTIDLPSGGTITVKLEADDYAYVQNRRAGEMFFINGFGFANSSGFNNFGSQLYNTSSSANAFIINVPDTSDYYRKYLDGLDNIYYRMEIDLANSTQYEYLSGYTEIDKSGNWYGVLDATRIWIKFKLNNNDTPIAKQGWQFLRTYLPEVAYPGSNDPGNNLGDALLGLISSLSDIINMVTGFSSHAKRKGWSRYFHPAKSFVRLNNPNYCKLGGGSRVKSIAISDNWGDMAPSGISKEYGQEYSYADTSGGKYKSSGVANWEPAIGNDENPFKQPVFYSVKRPMADKDEFYMEEPFGESFFPAPIVGYSSVKIANFSNEKIRRTATGYKEVKFYTAKDYPVITSRTGIDSRRHKPPFRLTILGSVFSSEEWLVSQGYNVELNDMHGKQKSNKVFNAFGDEIASTYYYYKSNPFNGYQRLNNFADIIHPNGVIENSLIGQDIDFCMDMREQNTNTNGSGVDINSDAFILPFFIPLFIMVPPIMPKYTSENVQFRSSVAMKVIHKYGILEKVVDTKDGSTIETNNLLHDSETGEILLTQTQNEFNDPIYNWVYPAHWVYPNMGPSFLNTGFVIKNVQIQDGEILNSTITNLNSYLRDGDEVAVIENGQVQMNTYTISKFTTNDYRIMSYGYPLSLDNPLQTGNINVDIKIIRSGRKNMSVLPVGNLTTIKVPPIDSLNHRFSATSSNYITHAEATEYLDKWKVNCDNHPFLDCDTIKPSFCLSYFLNSIINYNINHSNNLFYSCYSDSLTIEDIYEMCNCICKPTTINDQLINEMSFYNPVCFRHQDPITLSLQFGEKCKLIMRSFNGNGINLDSLQPINPLGTDTSQVKVYVGVNHRDSVMFSVQCISCINGCMSLTDEINVDPYKIGLLNNWHLNKSWNYYTNRTEAPLTDTRIRDKGYFEQFTPFWEYNNGWSNSGQLNDQNWVSKNTVTRIIRSGAEVENKDALDHYSSALFGYRESLAKAIASNAKYKEIANDNFEDYVFKTACTLPCYMEHWNFENAIDSVHVYISNDQSHTGKNSLYVDTNSFASVFREINYIPEDSLYSVDFSNHVFHMYNGCIEKFSPDSGKYILSAWVKENGPCGPTGYKNDSIEVSFLTSNEKFYLHPSGVVIEGWQRYEDVFEVPSLATAINVILYAGSNSAYFDDIRIHPYHSNMKSYVYDPRSLRLMSELDANNYATFYEYDDEGKLVRIKKETERGIMTLKETRFTYKKQ